MTSGFSNLFIVTGPGSPSVLTNMAVSVEQHVDWIADLITSCVIVASSASRRRIIRRRRGGSRQRVRCDDPVPKADSWYLNANVPGKGRVFLPYGGGVLVYRQRCRAAVEDRLRSFILGDEVVESAAN